MNTIDYLPADRSPRMIDLTGHLEDLRGSLSPECRMFEPAPELYGDSLHRPEHPARHMPRMLLAFLIVVAAIVTAALASAQ